MHPTQIIVERDTLQSQLNDTAKEKDELSERLANTQAFLPSSAAQMVRNVTEYV